MIYSGYKVLNIGKGSRGNPHKLLLSHHKWTPATRSFFLLNDFFALFVFRTLEVT